MKINSDTNTEEEEEGEKKDKKENEGEKEDNEKERRNLEVELRAFKQDWRKELADQANIDEVVEQMAKMEIKQRKDEGDEESHEQLSNHWLKFKIWKVEEEWQAAKFNEFQASYRMGADTSKPREPAEKVQKENEQQKATQQVRHVDMDKEWHSSQGETKPILEKDLKKLDDPEEAEEAEAATRARSPEYSTGVAQPEQGAQGEEPGPQVVLHTGLRA